MRKDKPSFAQAQTAPLDWLAVFLGSLVLYAWSVTFDFSYFDDHVLILQNLHNLTDPNYLFRTFKEDIFRILHSVSAYYRPMLSVSFMWDAWLVGPNPWMYHLTNVLLHGANTLLVLSLFTTLGFSRGTSLFISFLFLLHPVNVAAVSWISGRNDSLLAFFALGAILSWLRFLKTHEPRHYLLHLLLFLAALCTKETAVIVPVVSCTLVLADPTFHPRLRQRALLILKRSWGWLPVVSLWLWARSQALGTNTLPVTLSDLFGSLWQNLPGVLQLLGKVFLPVNLSVFPNIRDTSLTFGVLSALAFAILLWKYRRLATLWSGVAWFLFFLLPTLVKPDMTTTPDFLEHRLYLPIVGLLLGIAAVLENAGFRVTKGAHRAIIALGLLSFVTLNIRHQANYRDRISFWENAAANSPSSPLAQKNLGAMHYLDGNLDKAEVYFLKALRLNEREPMVHNNLGLIAMNRGQLSAAESLFRKELELNPRYDNAHFNLGLLYLNKGDSANAVIYFRRTLELNPDHAEAKGLLERTIKGGSS